MATTSARDRAVPLAAASLWLFAISALFSLIALLTTGLDPLLYAIAALLVTTAVYATICVRIIRRLRRNPAPPRAMTPERRLLIRRFSIITAAEILGFMLVGAIGGATANYDLIAPLDILIVGIHFLPLAWLFRVPRYYAMGALFILITALTLALVPRSAQIGSASAWFVIPTLACTCVVWVTAAFNLREATASV